MEWVETTAKTVEEAKERALDQLGVAEDDAEFEVLEEPRAGLFGLVRGEARVRARIRPTEVRPKQDRRRGRRGEREGAARTDDAPADATSEASATEGRRERDDEGATDGGRGRSGRRREGERRPAPARGADGARGGRPERAERPERTERGDEDEAAVDPAAVGEAAAQFVRGLVDAFGATGATEVRTDGPEIEVTVSGDQLGLLIGPGGRTLLAVQDLTRVAAQRRLGDHETRLRVDVAGYRERRRVALERFARQVADQVRSTGVARAMEPMPSADRKVIHDTIAEIDGVASRSDGEDPQRRVVVVPEG